MRFELDFTFLRRSLSSKIADFLVGVPPLVIYIWVILFLAAIYPLASAVMNMGAKRIYKMMLGTRNDNVIKAVPRGFLDRWTLKFDVNTMLGEFQKYEKYGNLLEFYKGFHRCLLITDPEITREILLKRPKQFCRMQDPVGSKYIGLDQSVLDLEGSEWMKVRKIFNPTFTKSHISKHYERIVAEAHRWMARLLSLCIQSTSPYIFDMTFEPFTFTIRVISTLAFGVSSHEVNSCNSYFFSNQLFEDIRCILSYSGASVRELFRVVPWKSFQFHEMYEIPAQKASLRFTDHCWEVIDHILDKNQSKDCYKCEEDLSLIENLIENYKKGFITIDQLLANVKVAYIGGTDTTAVTISWCCYYLSLYPEYQDKVRDEMKTVLCDAKENVLNMGETEITKLLTMDKVQDDLPFTQAFVKETLRLKPPVANMIIRTLDGDVSLSNKLSLSRDDNIIINLEGMMRMPEIFDDPMVFYPFRWLETENKETLTKMNLSFMPFGAGARICPGRTLSLEESVVAVGLLASCFDVSLACDHTEIQRIAHLIAAPNKMPIVLTPRL